VVLHRARLYAAPWAIIGGDKGDTVPDASLQLRLKTATAAAHARAERSLLMRRVMGGQLPRSGYCRLLLALHGLYAVLDAALAEAASPLWHPALARSAALARDLAALHGQGWQQALDAGAEARAYAARLEQQRVHEPHLLVAHAYVRYLGDLHGGQMLAAAVRRGLALGDGEAVAFYDFGPPAQVLWLRAHLRSGLDALPLTSQQTDQIVAEARWAFDAHERMFAELA
jgi:heme oxygenase (biliverdin-producing, ferredoxin)